MGIIYKINNLIIINIIENKMRVLVVLAFSVINVAGWSFDIYEEYDGQTTDNYGFGYGYGYHENAYDGFFHNPNIPAYGLQDYDGNYFDDADENGKIEIAVDWALKKVQLEALDLFGKLRRLLYEKLNDIESDAEMPEPDRKSGPRIKNLDHRPDNTTTHS